MDRRSGDDSRGDDRGRRDDYRDRDRARERDRDRERDYRGDRDRRIRESSVEFLGRGESYRPRNARSRSPPRGDRDSSYRDRPRSARSRSPRGRADSYRSRDLPPADTYTPDARPGRPRSRSPGYRNRSRSRSPRRDRYEERERYREYRERDRDERARSPGRRAYSPRRDEDRRERRDRSPARPRYNRSPPPRSPAPRRERPYTPESEAGYRDRERTQRPSRGGYTPDRRDNVDRNYRGRSRSPRRYDMDRRPSDTYRRRSPSPRRPSGLDSATTSRRSSPPPVHPSRLGLVPDDRASVATRETPGLHSESGSPARNGLSTVVPTGPKVPPTGPSASRNFSSPALTPPVGPTGPTSLSYIRPNPGFNTAPRPRGGYSSVNIAPPGGYVRGWASNAPGGRPPGPAEYGSRGPRGPSGATQGNPPSGPRGGGHPVPRGPISGLPTYKGSHNTTSTTYPRTQRFGPVVSPVERHLSDLPQPIPGGRRHSAAPPANAAKIKKLEEESEKLRKQIDEKKKVLRQELHEWDNVGREATKYRLAGDLAEGNLKKLEEMGVGENYVPENGEAQKVPEQEERDD